MRVDIRTSESLFTFSFALEEGERRTGPTKKGLVDYVARGDCRFDLPEGWRSGCVHPDLLAAVALAISNHVVGERLLLNSPVSAALHEKVKEVFGFRLEPVDPALEPRTAPANSRPALCYSGGVDSTAALQLAPSDTVCVFLERVEPPDESRGGKYQKEAALTACALLRELGRAVLAVQSGMEDVRKPTGFANDLTMAAPVMLLADHLGIDSIAYGLIMESAYLKQGHRFRDYARTKHFLRYGGVAETVGLPFNLVTSGLSEVVTSRLVLQSPYHHVAQSCVRGSFAEPCMCCWKCFRKRMLESVLLEETLPAHVYDRMFAIPDVHKELAKVPIKHENVMAFIVQGYQGDHPEMLRWKQTLGTDDLDLRWTTRWYPKSEEVLADKYRNRCRENISRWVEPMDDADRENMESWDRSCR